MNEFYSDISPYSAEDCERIGNALAKAGVRVISPGSGIDLSESAKSLLKFANDIEDKHVKYLLLGLHFRMMDVCRVAAFHQGAIIGQLRQLVKRHGKLD